MTKIWKPGAHVMHRGIANDRVWLVRPSLVVSDSPRRTLLLLVPGTRCKFPAGLITRKYSGPENSNLSRWDEQENPPWEMVDWMWRQKRFLTFLEPESYYSIALVWDHESDKFHGWYVNFELPFRRSPIGFDTLDLELDLVVSSDYSLRWKDADEYQEAIWRGVITTSTAERIAKSQHEVLEKIKRREEPFGESWLDWIPDSRWGVPVLHPDWEKLGY